MADDNTENEDDLELHHLDELVGVAKDIPYWQWNDPYVREKIAEAFARDDGDMSEAGIKKQLMRVDREYKEWVIREALRMEKCYKIFGWTLMLVGIGIAVVVQIIVKDLMFCVVGMVLLITGFVLNQISQRSQEKRLENPSLEE